MGTTQLATLKQPNKEVEQFVNFLETRKITIQNLPNKSERTTWNLQIKWKDYILEILHKSIATKSRLKKVCKVLILITEKIKFQCFIKAISVLTAIDNYQIQHLNSKSFLKQKQGNNKQSKNVFVDMDKQFKGLQKMKESIETEVSSPPNSVCRKHNKSLISQKEEKSKITLILSVEFNRNYHPFYHYKEQFFKFYIRKYRNKVPTLKMDEKNKDHLHKEMQKDLDFFINFLIQASHIYKKWILSKVDLNQQKYLCFMRENIITFLFCCNNQFYLSLLQTIEYVNQSYFLFLMSRIKENMHVQKYGINQQLQIQGNFINSMQLLSEIQEIDNPYKLLDFLEHLKNEICNDIDLHHKYFQTNENFTIDGDNLLSIICFQICKLKPKIPKIYSQLVLILLIYGQNAHIQFGASSYMLTVAMAAFEYMQGPEFLKHTA